MTRTISYAVVGVWIVLTALVLAVLPLAASTVAAVVASAALVVLARHLRLTADDLGLARDHLGAGTRWAAGSVLAFTLAYAAAVAVPATRDLLVDDRAPDSLAALAVRVLAVIPLHTVVLEELAFRGVVQGMVRRDRGVRAGVVVSSVLFGLWHLGSAGAALDGNEAVAGAVGTSAVTTVLGMLAIVVATGLAGVVLALARERSGSLLAPIGLHWAANAAGTVATYVATR